MTRLRTRGSLAPLRLLLTSMALVAAFALAACGDDDEGDAPAASGNGTDLAFVQDMTPHHESAIEMAQIARERSRREEITALADAIITSQGREIAQMKQLSATLEQDGVTPGALGVSAHDAGMAMDTSSLTTAEPFDRAFIDVMIPHHQGAIRMARAVLAEGTSAEVERLATAIVAAQAKEIEQMNDWRTAWYGAPSPAGGVPAQDAAAQRGDDAAADGHDDGGH